MSYATRVIALSREQAKAYRSDDPYVVISLTDTGADHPYLEPRAALKDRLLLQFDDIYPGQALDAQGFPRLCEMKAEDAERVADFVNRWWGEVAAIVVHCHAGLSRSTGVAAAIRSHHAQDQRDLFETPRSPNRHCLELVRDALGREGTR